MLRKINQKKFKWIFENHTLKALNIPFKKSSFTRKSQMWLYGRGNSGGSWLPEEKKNLKCGLKEEIVVANGRLPSPSPTLTCFWNLGMESFLLDTRSSSNIHVDHSVSLKLWNIRSLPR